MTECRIFIGHDQQIDAKAYLGNMLVWSAIAMIDGDAVRDFEPNKSGAHFNFSMVGCSDFIMGCPEEQAQAASGIDSATVADGEAA